MMENIICQWVTLAHMAENEPKKVVDSVKAVNTLFDILELLHQRNWVTISEAASALGYAKSTIHRYLSTLE